MQDCKEYAGHDKVARPWSYFDWVHSTTPDSTTAKFSFVFYLCLGLGGDSDKARARAVSYLPHYVTEDICSRLAAMCRQQNDCVSLTRDREEGNLGGADFPDLCLGGVGVASGENGGTHAAKKMLFRVAALPRMSARAWRMLLLN